MNGDTLMSFGSLILFNKTRLIYCRHVRSLYFTEHKSMYSINDLIDEIQANFARVKTTQTVHTNYIKSEIILSINWT